MWGRGIEFYISLLPQQLLGGLGGEEEREGRGGGDWVRGELNSIFPCCRSSCWVGWVVKRRERGGRGGGRAVVGGLGGERGERGGGDG